VVRRFGLEPKVALVTHSDFGGRDTPSSVKMRAALALIREAAPDLEVDGEMQADTALQQAMPRPPAPRRQPQGAANLLVMPSLDAANIAYNLVKAVTRAVPVGPILLGPRLPAHIVNQTVTSRGVVNMSAVACVVDALGVTAAQVG
jgi:malate dehydrogenase (oxaloacetate-decarboxylating)(NADP+)